MIRIFCYSIISLSILSAQFSSNVINGFGNDDRVISSSSESMGGLWLYNSSYDGWDPFLASSINRKEFTMIGVSSSVEGVESDYYKLNSHLINSINFSFPFNLNTALSIGLSPYTRTGYYLEDREYIMIGGTEYSSPLASKSTYNIQGGISKFSIALSQSFFNNKVALGFKWNVLFGNQEISTTTSLAELSYNQSGDNIFTLKEILYGYEFNHFNGYLYEVDSRVAINSRSSFSFLASFLKNLEIDNAATSQLFSISKNYSFDSLELDEFALGYMYNKDNKFGIAFETHFKNQIQYIDEILILNSTYPQEISFHNGLYKNIKNTKLDSWNYINLSGGYSYKQIKFDDQDFNDVSFSVGLGMSFNNTKNNINISFTFGSRESIVETISRESYYKLNMAIFSGEKWFVKRRGN